MSNNLGLYAEIVIRDENRQKIDSRAFSLSRPDGVKALLSWLREKYGLDIPKQEPIIEKEKSILDF